MPRLRFASPCLVRIEQLKELPPRRRPGEAQWIKEAESYEKKVLAKRS
jgi:hypothetical protein